ncbi:MAG: ATP-binding protein [Dehalococcoidia bacterium]
MPEPASASGGGARVAERLADARQRGFVGRQAEIELFRAALREEEPPFNLLFIYGPGGIGKTTLLQAFRHIAAEAGRPAIYLDGHDTQPSPHGFTFALSQALDLPHDSDPLGTLSTQHRLIVFIDTFETLEPLQDWLRNQFLPLLPADTIVVIAGRNAPAEPWRSDPGWAGLSRIISLRNLRPEESRALLAARGVPAARQEDILRFTYGHPLALSLAAELAREGRFAEDLETAGLEVVGALLQRFVSSAPSPLQQQAIEASSIAYRMTQATLAAALQLEGQDETARELFHWLRGLPTMEQGRDGLFPHDIARDTIFQDLRLRDPEQIRRLSGRIAALESNRFLKSQGPAQHAAFWGMMYARRHLPSVAPFYDWAAMGQAFAQPARVEDREQILAIVGRHEGEASARVAARWFESQREAFHVFRSIRGELAGFACHLLVNPDDQQYAFDPALTAVRDHIRRLGPLRPDERVSLHRYWMGRDDYQSATAHNTTAPTAVAQWMTASGLAWSFVVLRDIDFWLPAFAFIGFQRASGADFSLGAHRYGMVVHDWRAEPPPAWWQSAGRRYDDRGAEPVAPVRLAEPVVVLSQPEFADAVRRAYRDYARRDALAANPLARSRLVREAGPAGDAATVLQALLRQAVESLRGHPRDEKLHRALWHTYIEPAPTQEAAAELLDLPFSTYRRHLRAGLERATEWLWLREVYGPASD